MRLRSWLLVLLAVLQVGVPLVPGSQTRATGTP